LEDGFLLVGVTVTETPERPRASISAVRAKAGGSSIAATLSYLPESVAMLPLTTTGPSVWGLTLRVVGLPAATVLARISMW
jgi:hypothetical protein